MSYTTTPPGTLAPPTLTGTAPASTTPAAISTTAPSATTPAALSSGAPGAVTPAAVSGVAPTATTPAVPSITAPGATTPATLTSTPAVELPPDRSINSLPSMPASFTPAFINLSGTGPTLKTLNASAADATVGRVVTGIVGGEIKNFQVRSGTDAEALPGIVHPANYDATNNAVVFVAC